MDEMINAIRRQFGYMLSLPERTIRSLAAVASGTGALLTESLFPDTVRDSTFYKFFIGDMQRFVTEQIAQIPPEPGSASADAAGSPDFMQRKVVGSALETAGLFAMHVSPLWVFALAGDAAAGSTVFLNRLVEQLKNNGVIPKHTEINGLTDLLAAVQEASRRSASVVDTPPLSREELSRLASDMTQSYRQMFSKATNLVPRLDDLWTRLNALASRENISLERLSGAMAVDVADMGKRGIGVVLAFGQTGADLVGEKILTSYAKTLEAMTQQGVSNYISTKMRPFLRTALSHFDPDRASWTETKLGLAESATAPGAVAATAPAEAPSPPPTDGSRPDQTGGGI